MSSFRSLARNVITVGLSGVAGQVLAFLALPVLSRLYAPAEFGVWALFVSVGLVIGAVATLRYELAVVLPHRDTAGAAVAYAGLGAAAITSVLTAILLYPISWIAFNAEQSAQLGVLIWALPVFIFSAACVQLGLAWCTRRMRFVTYSCGQFALSVSTLALQVAAFMAGVGGVHGLVIGFVAGYVIAALVLWVPILGRDHATFVRALSVNRVFMMGRRYFQYPAYMTPYTIISTLRDRAVYFLIGRFGDASVVGYYTLAQRFTNLPNSFVSSAVRPIFFQHAARQDLANLESGVFAIMVALLLLVGPNLVVFWFHAEALLTSFFGPKWIDASAYAIVLSVPAMALLLGNWFDRALDVMGRQRLALVMEAVFSVLTIAALIIGFVISRDVWDAVVVQASAMTVYFVIWIVVVFRAAGYRTAASLQLIAGGFVLIALSAAGLWLLERSLPVVTAVVIYYAIYVVAGGVVATLRYQKLRNLF